MDNGLPGKAPPYIDSPPVPLPFVKSPPCTIKSFMTRWNGLNIQINITKNPKN